MRKTVLVLIVIIVTWLAPAPSSAATLARIVSLSRAGVSDAVLIALIEREPPNVPVDGEELIALREQGVSEAVLIALLAVPPAPEIIVVGHGPDRPIGAQPTDAVPTDAVPTDAANDALNASPAIFAPSVIAVPFQRSGDAALVRSSCSIPQGASPAGHATTTIVSEATSNVGHITTRGVGHISVSGVGHITTSGVGHILNPPSTIPALSPGACVRVAPRSRARRRP